MKAFFKVTALAIFMFTSLLGMANEPILNIEVKDDVKSLVFKVDSEAEVTFLKLADNKESVIYSKKVSKENGYASKFGITGLEDGIYTFKTDSATSIAFYIISIEGTNVKIMDKMEHGKPMFRKDGDMVFLNLLNSDRNEVSIKVYDGNNEQVFNETVSDDITVQKAFNFKNIDSDDYTILVKDGESIHYEYITIK